MTGHFEAKKHAYRQTQDGIVVSFVIHPNDVDAAFAVAPLGTRYMVGFAEIGEDGKPIENIAARGRIPAVVTAPEQPGQTTGPASSGMPVKDRKPFASLPLSQQAAIRGSDPAFRTFLAKDDDQFLMYDAHMAADEVRHRCGVKSRAELDKDAVRAAAWRTLNKDFEAWSTTRQYADARR